MSKPRSAAAAPISTVLSGLLRKLQTDARPSLEEIAQVWKRLAGEEAAQHSWPRRLVQQRLVVEVENSGWMYALGMKKAHLLEGLVELLGTGRVRELSFRMGERRDG